MNQFSKDQQIQPQPTYFYFISSIQKSMLEPEQQLRKLSFDSDLEHVLKTPNRIKYKQNDFEGWEHYQHSLQSPQQKLTFNISHSKTKFKVKPSKIKINPESIAKNSHYFLQNKQNNQHEKMFNLKMVQMIDYQTLSPNSRKLLTPEKPKLLTSPQHPYQTPKSTHRTRPNSLHKLSATEGMAKFSFSQKREKFQNLNQQNPFDDPNSDQHGYKIPLSSIVYPVLKANNKKTLRRIQRFHSFVARTVRK